MHVHTLVDKRSLSEVRKQIRAELNEVGAHAAEAFDCLVAVSEACTNAIVHGHDAAGGRDPEIAWEIGPETASFEVRDFSGRGAAIEAHPSADGSKKPESDERDGGYGLDVMRQLMDEVEIEIDPGGTTVSMVKRFTTVSSQT